MIECRPLRETELEAWFHHCASVFETETVDYFRRHFELDPDRDISLIFAALDNGEIVSTVRVFPRSVWIDGRTTRIGGIGEVSTKPAYRKQGLAGKLLQMAIDAMDAREMPVSILFGDEALYERLGWRFCASEWTFARTEGSLLPEGFSIRAYEGADLPAVMGLYDLFAGRLNGAIIRSEAYWKSWVLSQWRSPLVLVQNGRIAGYFTGSISDGVFVADELCAAPGMESVLSAAVLHSAGAIGCASAKVRSALLPGLSGERERMSRAMMVRPEAVACMMVPNAGCFGVDGF